MTLFGRNYETYDMFTSCFKLYFQKHSRIANENRLLIIQKQLTIFFFYRNSLFTRAYRSAYPISYKISCLSKQGLNTLSDQYQNIALAFQEFLKVKP